MNEEIKERLGRLADEVDNLCQSLTMNIPDSIHVNAMREIMPELCDEIKNIYISLTGENPWNNDDLNY